MCISLVGVIFASGTIGKWINSRLTYLATFSAGVFIVVAYFLAEEAVHEGGWVAGVGSVVLGAAVMEAIRFFFPAPHHHHGPHDHGHTHIDGRQVLLSDALHNIGDGILLVGAFASNIYVGLAATVGVLLHETVQEVSEYFVLREAGYSNRGALLRNFAVSSTILIGFVFAAYLSSMEFFLALLSGIAAGGFLSVVLHDLLPHAIASARAQSTAVVHVLAIAAGLLAMLGVQMLMPHEEHAPEVTPEVTIESTMEVRASETANTATPPRNDVAPQKAAATDVPTAPQTASTTPTEDDGALSDGSAAGTELEDEKPSDVEPQ